MNIIKIENVSNIQGFHNKLEISTKGKSISQYSNTTLVVFSEEDVHNDNCLIKLRGYNINALLIPKKYKYTFLMKLLLVK